MNKKIIQQIWLPILLVLVCLCTPFTSVYAQNIRVTIQLKDVRMKQVMTEIEKQTRYLFAIDDDVDVTRSVSVNVVNQPLQEALIQMVKGSDINYQISGSNIILKKQPIQKPVTISGTVQDQHKQPIVGASIIVKGTAVGTSTNADGSFSLQIPPPHNNSSTGN
jgi:outer membrane receptor proteins, mostly Fe transport